MPRHDTVTLNEHLSLTVTSLYSTVCSSLLHTSFLQLIVVIPPFQQMVPLSHIKTQLKELRYSSGVIQCLSQLGGWGQCVEQMGDAALTLLVLDVHVRWCGKMMYGLWSCTITCKFTPLVSCGTPFFSDRVDVDTYNSTMHRGFRDCLPVSARASTRGKDDLSVWGRWEVGP